MLKKIEDLPSNILGVRAEGKVTQEDYETVLIPLLKTEHRQGRHIRFLYQFSPEFSGFTAGAVLDDFRVGLKYLRLFERCAIVSDIDWIRGATHFVGAFMPCSTQVFKNDQLKDAVKWLASEDSGSKLKFELTDKGVLIVHPNGPLKREDFDKVASIMDPWIETHHHLRGLVVCIQKFPGWENVGSFIHHMEFINSHERKIRRVALAVDGTLPEMVSKVASHFVEAEIKQFPFEKVEEAVKWANS